MDKILKSTIRPSQSKLTAVLSPKRGYHYNSDRFKNFGYNRQINLRKPGVTVSDAERANRAKNCNIHRVINSFRAHGHRVSNINPLGNGTNFQRDGVPELDLSQFHLNLNDQFDPSGLLNGEGHKGSSTVQEAVDFLKETYCGVTGYEFMHVEEEAEREWLAREIERRSTQEIPDEKRLNYAIEMVKSQNFDRFLATKFPTIKRYGGEGCESVMAFYLELFDACTLNGVDNVIIGMAHRGRLNFLAGPLRLPPVKLFHKMKGFPEFAEGVRGSGDVLTHLGTSVNIPVDGRSVHVSLLNNPSHLEAVNPVAVGKCRAKQYHLNDYDYAASGNSDPPRVLCLQIHGDAAISAQGINQETLGLANVPNYRIGGSVHLVINNQIGFTTPQELGRSTRYATDVAKMIHAPVIHVNGAYPEEVAKAAQLAIAYRQEFEKDIFVDLICFRRWGHNEMDDPTFTNPEMYKIIHSRKSLPDEYCEKLLEEKVLTDESLRSALESHTKDLNEHFYKAEEYIPDQYHLQVQWHSMVEPNYVNTTWDTGADISLLKYIGSKSVEIPENFNIHPQLHKTHVKSRLAKITSGTGIDWSTAESLAVGSLLYQGFGVRLSGEDVGRGTFSHRHMMLVDQNTGETFYPLNSMHEKQDKFIEIANSTLSEEAVLGFEYGYSTEHPDNLVIWEAQFGDFFNGAQIIIDTFIASGETKWLVKNGMVILLPHGLDGVGPEHSSCRIERFLELTDSNESSQPDGDYNNMQVVFPTTPAQYFHLLRRQVLRDFRKPLVVIAPKIMIRLSAATSSLSDMGPGTHFKPVIGETSEAISPSKVKKLVFVTGKHYYNLRDRRDELRLDDVALVRVESLCPFPVDLLQQEISKYPNAKQIIWSQEEHRNQGAWPFVQPRFQNFLGISPQYVGRGILGSPAVGIPIRHQAEAAQILRDTFTD